MLYSVNDNKKTLFRNEPILQIKSCNIYNYPVYLL